MSGMIGGLLSLFGGVILGGFGWWYGRKKALAKGWQITFVGMFLFYFLIMIGVNIKSIQLISFLYIILIAGWAGARFYYEAKY